MAVAGLLVSVVSLQSGVFDKAVGYVGLLASIATFANDLSLILAPMLAAILMPINSLLWLVWWPLISRSLFKESKK